jgi:hypothetical protein
VSIALAGSWLLQCRYFDIASAPITIHITAASAVRMLFTSRPFPVTSSGNLDPAPAMIAVDNFGNAIVDNFGNVITTAGASLDAVTDGAGLEGSLTDQALFIKGLI